jgi:hypothetical protein
LAETLVDLDELVLKCKSLEAKTYISEAVKCYKIGAFKAAIVSTWIAVVYDFIHKLRLLEVAGDIRAGKKLAEFEKARNNIKLALEFERKLLDSAQQEFELLTPLELIDFNRLQEDRNRCAHPSMRSLEEIYEPSAELARYHLTNSVIHLLQHSPVQGKYALAKLQAETLSETFPVEYKKAVEIFRNGALGNPKDSLLRDYIISTVRAMFDKLYTERQLHQFASALMAIRDLHGYKADEILKEVCSRTIAGVDDQEFKMVIQFICFFGDSWQYLPENIRIKIETFTVRLNDSHVDTILLALRNPNLEKYAIKCIDNLSIGGLKNIVAQNPQPYLLPKAIELLELSTNPILIDDCASSLLRPLIDFIKPKEIEQLFRLGTSSQQIRENNEIKRVLELLTRAAILTKNEFRRLATNYMIWANHYQDFYVESLDAGDDIPF